MTIKSMINAARQGNPAEFERALGSVVAEKLSHALTAKRAEVASSLLGISLKENEGEDRDDVEDEDREDGDDSDEKKSSSQKEEDEDDGESEIREWVDHLTTNFTIEECDQALDELERIINEDDLDRKYGTWKHNYKHTRSGKLGKIGKAVYATGGAVAGGLAGGPAGAAIGAAAGYAAYGSKQANLRAVAKGIHRGARAVNNLRKRIKGKPNNG